MVIYFKGVPDKVISLLEYLFGDSTEITVGSSLDEKSEEKVLVEFKENTVSVTSDSNLIARVLEIGKSELVYEDDFIDRIERLENCVAKLNKPVEKELKESNHHGTTKVVNRTKTKKD